MKSNHNRATTFLISRWNLQNEILRRIKTRELSPWYGRAKVCSLLPHELYSNRCADLKSRLFAQTPTHVCSLHTLNIISQYTHIYETVGTWQWRFISGCPVDQPFSSFPSQRDGAWCVFRLDGELVYGRKKKAIRISTYGDGGHALWVSQPRPATNGL